jgi:cell division septation protein DedD
MKEKLIGFIFLFLIIAIALANLLKGNGMTFLNQYSSEKITNSNFLTVEEEQLNEAWVIHVATFKKYQDAFLVAKEIDSLGLRVVISPREIDKKMIYRIRVLPRKDWDRIDKAIKKLEKNNFSIKILKNK